MKTEINEKIVKLYKDFVAQDKYRYASIGRITEEFYKKFPELNPTHKLKTEVEWISVSKQKPPKNEETIKGTHTMGEFKHGIDIGPLLAFNGVSVFPAYWRKTVDGWQFVEPHVDDYLADPILHVTHWAQLPDGPK